MDKAVAVLVWLGCAFYAEPGSAKFFQAFVLPLLFILSSVYLLGFIASLIVSAAALCFWNSDLGSSSVFDGVVLPLLGVFCLLVLLYQAWKSGMLGKAGGYGHGDSGGGGFDGGGGGCDGGGGE